ncbi:hypothetical protein FQZ97_874900 [compost metagenome]
MVRAEYPGARQALVQRIPRGLHARARRIAVRPQLQRAGQRTARHSQQPQLVIQAQPRTSQQDPGHGQRLGRIDADVPAQRLHVSVGECLPLPCLDFGAGGQLDLAHAVAGRQRAGFELSPRALVLDVEFHLLRGIAQPARHPLDACAPDIQGVRVAAGFLVGLRVVPGAQIPQDVRRLHAECLHRRVERCLRVALELFLPLQHQARAGRHGHAAERLRLLQRHAPRRLPPGVLAPYRPAHVFEGKIESRHGGQHEQQDAVKPRAAREPLPCPAAERQHRQPSQQGQARELGNEQEDEKLCRGQ